jgi:hypothetical protein
MRKLFNATVLRYFKNNLFQAALWSWKFLCHWLNVHEQNLDAYFSMM